MMESDLTRQPSEWFVYMILCSDNSIYTGITTNLRRRFQQHANAKGAKYFRGRIPEKVVYLEQGHDRSSASKRERTLKQLNRSDKIRLINNFFIHEVNNYQLHD